MSDGRWNGDGDGGWPSPESPPPLNFLNIVLGLMIVFIIALAVGVNCSGGRAAMEEPSPPSLVAAVPEIQTSAAAAVIAQRVEPPTTTAPPPTAEEICNGLVYEYEVMYSPMTCFRVVAAEQGIVNITSAEAWIFDVIVKESGGCPFLRGGSSDIRVGCEPRIKGSGSDTGFGQATRSYWGPTGKLCTIYGVCSSEAILQSAYHSMLNSVVRVAMLDGRYGYCDYEGAPILHNCGLVSKAWRLA